MQLSLQDIDRIIEMAWEDRTPFEAIKFQFQLSESQVIALMRKEMHPNNFKKWRARTKNISHKHAAIMPMEIDRFKSKMQRTITLNRISKR